MNWYDARAYCQKIAGDLASFLSQEDVDGISTAVGNHFHWIGLTDQLEEDEWVWSDGSTVTWLKWKNNQPNDGEEGNCALLKNGEVWDHRCEDKCRFVCKIPGIYLRMLRYNIHTNNY